MICCCFALFFYCIIMEERSKISQKKRENSREDSYGVGAFLLEIIKVFFLALVIITPIRIFLFQPFFVQGASMEPNFENGEYLIISELGYKKTDVGLGYLNFFTVHPFRQLERGDIAVFRYAKGGKQYYIKRVVGLPGEKIRIEHGKIIIFNKDYPSGTVVDEGAYLSEERETGGEMTVEIPADAYFFMGDNRSSSYDSRSFGPVKKDVIVGKVLIRAWPFHKAAIF